MELKFDCSVFKVRIKKKLLEQQLRFCFLISRFVLLMSIVYDVDTCYCPILLICNKRRKISKTNQMHSKYRREPALILNIQMSPEKQIQKNILMLSFCMFAAVRRLLITEGAAAELFPIRGFCPY